MAILQSSYAARLTALQLGQIVNQELQNAVSRLLEDATAVGYGRALYRGANDNGVTATRTLTGAGSEPASGNTGNGTITDAPAVTADAQIGRYVITIVEPGTNVGSFIVEAPDGTIVGEGVVATEFVGGGLTFTVADGSTDFAAGDRLFVDVTGNGFEGITFRDTLVESATADTFERYDTMPLLKQGVVAVQGSVAVTKGQQAYVTSAGAWTNVATGNIKYDGATFDGTTAAAGLVALRLK